MVGINDESGRNHRLFPTWHEHFDEVKPAMRNAIVMGASEQDPRSIYITARSKPEAGPELSYGEQLLQSYKCSIPSTKAQGARFRTLRKLETILEPKVTRHRDGSTRYTGNTEWWDGGPRYVLGLHGSIILNLDDDGSDLDVVIMDRKYTDGAWPTDFAAEPEALHNLVSIHDIFDGKRGLETLSFTGSAIHMVDRETQVYLNITLNALHLMYSTLLIRQYALMRPLTFLPLCHFLHRLLDERRSAQYRHGRGDPDNSNSLGHHAANLLVLFHLQTSATPDWPFPILHSPEVIQQTRGGFVWKEDLRIPREVTRDTWVGQVSYCWPIPAGWSLADKLAKVAEDKKEAAERVIRRREKAEANVQREAEVRRKRKVELDQFNGKNAQKMRRLFGGVRASSYPASVLQSESDDSDDDVVSMRPCCPSVSAERSSGESDSEDYDSDIEETVVRRGLTFTEVERRQPTPLLSGPVVGPADKDEQLDAEDPIQALEAATDAERRSARQSAQHDDLPANIPSHVKGKGRMVHSPAPPSPSSPETHLPSIEQTRPSPSPQPITMAASSAAPPPSSKVPDLVEPAARLEEELLSLLFFLQSFDPKSQPVRVQLGRDSTRAEWKRDQLQGMARAKAAAGSFDDEVVIEDTIQPGWNLTPDLPARVLETLGEDCSRVLEEMASDETRPLSELLHLAVGPVSPPTPPLHRPAPYRPSPPPGRRQPSRIPSPRQSPAPAPSRHSSQAPRHARAPPADMPNRQSTARDQPQRRATPLETPQSIRPQRAEPRLPPPPRASPAKGWTLRVGEQDVRRISRPTAADMFPRAPSPGPPPSRRRPSQSPVLPASPPPPVARPAESASPPSAPPQAQPKRRVWKVAPGAMRGTGAPAAPPK